MASPRRAPGPLDLSCSRRAFLGLAAAAGAAAVTLPRWGLPGADASEATGDELLEVTVSDLQRLMAGGATTSAEVTRFYLDRIRQLNPLLHAVLEKNPDALRIAKAMDRERRQGHVRGPLHGVPVLLKDNIATADHLNTTSGSAALVGAAPRQDAVIVARLRQAGAVILGKANQSEWANFRGFGSVNGWSARGGFTRNPYLLSADPLGSSSGSAVAAAANLTALAVGTETDGSITGPAGCNNVVGLKPTIGLVSQQGVIPISASQDCAGPMTRTVRDAAVLLGALQSPFAARGVAPPAGLPNDYTTFLRPDALRGARIGLDPQFFSAAAQEFGPEDAPLLEMNNAVQALRDAGATVVDVSIGDLAAWFDPEFTVLLTEFKVGVADYLLGVGGTTLRSLSDLIAYNLAHCDAELRFFGQELFELAEATTGLGDPAYQEAVATIRGLTVALDWSFGRNQLDALAGPSFSYISTPAAVAGWPHISVPGGFDQHGRPKGLSLVARPFQDGKLLGYAYAFEQAFPKRRMPRFEGAVPPKPPRFEGCAAPSARVAPAWRPS